MVLNTSILDDEIKDFKERFLNGQNVLKLLATNLNHIVYQYILYELASEFHSYWNLGKQNPRKKVYK